MKIITNQVNKDNEIILLKKKLIIHITLHLYIDYLEYKY